MTEAQIIALVAELLLKYGPALVQMILDHGASHPAVPAAAAASIRAALLAPMPTDADVAKLTP